MPLHFSRAEIQIFVLLNVLLTFLNGSQSKEEWKNHKDYNYLFLEKPPLSWYYAEKICRGNNALLASIENEDENIFITKEIKKTNDAFYWIGMSSLNERDNFQWLDETPLHYENWAEDSNHNDSLTRDKCVKINSASGKWQDDNCKELAGVICKMAVDKEKRVSPPLPTLPPNGRCPKEWLRYDLKCYKIFTEPLSWNSAKERCRSIGQNHDLMSIHSTAENMFLTSVLAGDTWIGGRLTVGDQQQGWSDNTPFDYTRLLNGPSLRDTNVKCVQVLSDEHNAGSWKAISCSEERMYICQRHIDPLIPIHPTSLPSKCDNEFVEYRGDCYLSTKNELKTWTEAEKYCERFGAHLASIGNVYEDAFIYSYLYPLSSDVWIGLRGEKRLFKWFNTWPLYYTNWMSGYPGVLAENTMQCVVLDEDILQWKIQDCDSKQAFLCKISNVEPPEVEKIEGVCPDHLKTGIDLEGLYCYSVYNKNKADWLSAAKTCEESNTTLASLHSEHEIKLLGPHLKGLNDVWIGLQTLNGTYKWVDESPLDFVHWNEEGTSVGDCVAISFPSLTWKKMNCEEHKPFICSTPKVIQKNKEGKQGSAGLSSGEIAGIVIGVLLGLTALVAIVEYIRRSRRPN